MTVTTHTSISHQALNTKSDLVALLDKVAPTGAVLDINALSDVLSLIVNTLNIQSVLSSPDVPTLRYYRRDSVGVLSDPVSTQGGYTRRHVLEALYARLTAVTKTATLKEVAEVLANLSDAKLLQYAFDLLKQAQTLASAKLELAKLEVEHILREAAPQRHYAAGLVAPDRPAVRSMAVNTSLPLASLAAWPMPDGATLLLPENHPAFASSEKQAEFLDSVKQVFKKS